MGALHLGLLFQGDFLGQDPGLGHDAEACGIARADKGIAGPLGQGFAFAAQALQIALEAGFLDLPFGKAGEPGDLAPLVLR
jgi:hypothetical protein